MVPGLVSNMDISEGSCNVLVVASKMCAGQSSLAEVAMLCQKVRI